MEFELPKIVGSGARSPFNINCTQVVYVCQEGAKECGFRWACVRWTLGEARTGGRPVERDAIRMKWSVNQVRSHAERGIEELKALVPLVGGAHPTKLAEEVVEEVAEGAAGEEEVDAIGAAEEGVIDELAGEFNFGGLTRGIEDAVGVVVVD